jgi:hypothetical protein
MMVYNGWTPPSLSKRLIALLKHFLRINPLVQMDLTPNAGMSSLRISMTYVISFIKKMFV